MVMYTITQMVDVCSAAGKPRSRSAIKDAVKYNRLPAQQVGRQWVITKEDADRFVKHIPAEARRGNPNWTTTIKQMNDQNIERAKAAARELLSEHS